MKVNKAQTIRDLERVMHSIEYWIENYIKPHEEEVMQKQMKEMLSQIGKCSGSFPPPDSEMAGYRIIQLEDAIKTIKKLKK